MINVIVPITNNAEKYVESLSQLSLRSDVNLVIGITESLNKAVNLNFPNAKTKVFDDKSKKEEILNSLQYLLEDGKTLICRRPFSIKEYKEFTQTNAAIVFGKEKKENRIKALFQMLGQDFMQLVLGVKPFGGDFSLICFDEDMTSVLRQAENFSYSTRVDRWKGVEKVAVEVENHEKVKVENNKKNILTLLFLALGAVILGALVTTLVAVFAKVTIIIGLLLACLDIICVVTAFFCLFSLYFNSKIGQKHFAYAREIVVREENNEKN